MTVVKTTDADFVRDTSCNALINNNIKALQERRIKREHAERLLKLESDINYLMTSVQEIKSALKELGISK